MPFISGTAPTEDSYEAGYQKLFRIFRRFITGAPDPGTINYAGTGDGVMVLFDTKPDAPTETWTFTATSATNFTVTGSVSGAQAALTTDTDYENDFVAVRIEAGATPFVASDEFDVDVTATGIEGTNDQWLIDRYDYFDPTHEFIAHGQGLAGGEEIYVGILLSETPASTLYNWRIRGFTGYSDVDTFANQPGASPAVFASFWQFSIPYWIALNGRRFVIAAQVSTTFHGMYGGFILPFATPAEYPYPLMVGGESTSALAYTSTATGFRHFIDPGTSANGQLRDVNGLWKPLIDTGTPSARYAVWPWDTTDTARAWLAAMQDLPDGSYPLFPATILRPPDSGSTPFTGTVIGEMDGVFAITGFDNSAGTLIDVSGTDYLVVQNIFRTARENHWAMRLD